MLPDTGLSPGFGLTDGRQPDSTFDRDFQAIQSLEVQSAGGGLVDMTPTATSWAESSEKNGAHLPVVIQNDPTTLRDKASSSGGVRQSLKNPNSKSSEQVSESLGDPQLFDHPTVLEGVMHGGGTSKHACGGKVLPPFPNSSPLSDLPSEILSQILLLLPVLDILHSQAVCSSLNSFITSSVQLQYRIALGISGLEDNKACLSFNTAERLNRILKARKSWRGFEPQFVTRLQTPSQFTGCYDTRGGIYLQSGGQNRSIDYTVLPRREEEGVEWNTIEFHGQCLDAALCMNYCDRLVAISASESSEASGGFDVILHIMQSSTGRPHPEVEQPRIVVSTGERVWPSPWVKIGGNNICILLMHPGRHSATLLDRLLVFDWKTGGLTTSFDAPSESYRGLGFLEENALILPNLKHGALEVWDLPPAASAPNTSLLVCILELPLLVPGMSYGRITCDEGPTLGKMNDRSEKLSGTGNPLRKFLRREQRPYHSSPEEAIIAFDVDIANRSYSFFIHRRSILQIVESCRQSRALPSSSRSVTTLGSAPVPVPIPWEQWGEKTTRWVETSKMPQRYITRLGGQRTVFTSLSSIIVLDFNPWLVKKYRYDLMEKQRNLEGSEEEQCEQRNKAGVMTERTYHVDQKDGELDGTRTVAWTEIEGKLSPERETKKGTWTLSETSIVDVKGNCFARPVKSELPCIRYSNSQQFLYDGVMMDEESILCFKQQSWSREGKVFDILYFGQG